MTAQHAGSTVSDAAETAPADPSLASKRAAPPPRPGKTAAEGPADTDAPEEEGAEEEEHHSWLPWRMQVPSWLISAFFHLAVLLVAAFLSFAIPEDVLRNALVINPIDAEEIEPITEFEVQDLENVDVLDHTPTPTAMVDPGMMNLGDPTEDFKELSDEGLEEVSDLDIGEIGSLFGRDGQGMASIGDGMGGAAFFGTVSSGNRFVYVIDNSNSMTKGRFETALNELVRSIDSMSSTSMFYVVFFSDTAYSMFHPNPAKGFMRASEENKAALKQWLRTVQLCLRTDGQKAMQVAFSLKPDAVYILGDGAFTDNTTKVLTAPHERPFSIHTFGMEVNAKGEWQLKDIAKANHGKYTLVAAHPTAQLMAKKNPVPRNSVRGPVWGVTLPAVRKQPGKGPGGRKGPNKKN